MALLTADLYSLIRQKLDDTVSPYLVSDTELYLALGLAQRRFAEETLCLPNDGTYTLAVVAGTATYAIDDAIMKLRPGYLVTSERIVMPETLVSITTKAVRDDYGLQKYDWRTATGTPEYMLTDRSSGFVTLVPIPVVTETMNLSGYLTPDHMTGAGDALEIPDRYRLHLVAGTLAELYLSQDNDIYDPKAASIWERKWAQNIASARSYIERDTRGPGIARASTQGLW